MIFVTGGAYSGKENCARKLLNISEEEWAARMARGGVDNFTSLLHKPYIADYHRAVRGLLEQGADPARFTLKMIEADPRLVIMDEVGCGVVPATKRENDYREAVGKCGQLLAAAAGEVYYVVSGIGTRIKPTP